MKLRLNRRARRFVNLGCLGFALLSFGFTGFGSSRPKLPDATLPLPLVTQETDFSCGPAAFLSILKYWEGYKGKEQDLYLPLHTTPDQGTHPRSLERVARERGHYARVYEGLTLKDLRKFLDDGATAILDIQAWPDDEKNDEKSIPWEERWEDGHYVVLMAMDARYVYVMDPSTEKGYAYMPQDEFVRRWHDYEIEGGVRREYVNAAVVIRGDRPESTKLSTRRLYRLR